MQTMQTMQSEGSRPELWRQNLDGDEDVLWSGATSEELRLKAVGYKRLLWVAVSIASLAIGAILCWNLAHPPIVTPCRTCAVYFPVGWNPLRIPAYLFGIFACGIVALFALAKLFDKVPAQRLYALTSMRVLTCDVRGTIINQIAADNIAGLRWKEGFAGPLLEVRRKGSMMFDSELVVRDVVDMAGLKKALTSWLSPA